MTALQQAIGGVGLVLVLLAIALAVDKRRPLRHLDDQPDPPHTGGPWLDGDLDRLTDDRIAAESRLYRKAR
ncbi:hypothetical protein L3Q65_45910 [Amycolatopsis sp. FU40]|uniref:hypothetical protein n=1 Tax=Amycolatopsis sp. FU40 TaxID=2914159 RepID=UPI001F1E2F7E|nr:hypothetical protein [Amycolatopsis sp. FU40]UKD55111.1 hypothetical protein L3Q65_45910 [Amycolatopsis sp. FU40]